MTPSTDDLLAALLRGDRPEPVVLQQRGDALFAAAAAHDIVSLVAERLAAWPGAPADLRLRFQPEAVKTTAADLAREVELRRLLDTLQARGIDAVLFKGAHLAYTHYARPDLRARVDTDLLIARADLDRADAVLTGDLGYVADLKPSGEFTGTQRLYVLTRNGADVHLVDLHWRLANPQVFAHVLAFDELWAQAVLIPALGGAARAPSNVHALLIACMHRVAHHHDQAEQLKWLYDIHLLAAALTGDEWEQFHVQAAERGVTAVCRDSLARAERWFHTRLPIAARGGGVAQPEATAAYLTDRSKARALLDDLRALPSTGDRLRLLHEHLFPGPAYMRGSYAPGSRWPLPLLYAARIVRGAGAWLRPR